VTIGLEVVFTFGDAQKWEGEDTITRINGTEVGTPPSSPPDPKP
jgi:hypothetical protein